MAETMRNAQASNDTAMLAKSRVTWLTPEFAVRASVLAVLMAVLYWHVLDRLVTIWRTNGDWSHGFIIPLFSLYYLYLRRDRMPLEVSSSGNTARVVGIAIMALSFWIYWHFASHNAAYPQALSLVLAIFGVVLLSCGWPMTRWSWFAIAFLLFALPVPQRLYVQMTMPLRFIAANVSAVVLELSLNGMMATARGAVVEYMYQGHTGTLDIEQACSGIRLMMTMSALGVAMAFVSDRPLWQRLIMILSCVPISIFCNIIRVTTTGFMVVFGKNDFARGFWHMMLGLGMLAIAFCLYGSISYVLSHLFIEDPVEQEGQPQMVGGSVG